MFRNTSLVSIIAFALALETFPASAQEKSCPTMECRALGYFRTCDKPLDGAKILSARVLATSRECSNNILSVQVENGKANDLPPVVEIDLGPCVSFYGKIGDATQIALVEPPGLDMRRYHLACRIW